MRTHAIKRVLLIVPTLFLVTVLVFLSVRLVPGTVVDVMLGDLAGTSGFAGSGSSAGVSTTPLDREAIESMLGLDLPMHVQ